MSDIDTCEEVKEMLFDNMTTRVICADIPCAFEMLCGIHSLMGDGVSKRKKRRFIEKMLINYDENIVVENQIRSQRLREMVFVGYVIEQLKAAKLLPETIDIFSPQESLRDLIPSNKQHLLLEAGY